MLPTNDAVLPVYVNKWKRAADKPRYAYLYVQKRKSINFNYFALMGHCFDFFNMLMYVVQHTLDAAFWM